MHGNLIFSRGGVSPSGPNGPQKPYRVSPALFSQYPAINRYFLPDGRELPRHGLQAQILIFDFGFSLPSQTVGPMDSQFFQLAMASNFLACAITGVSDVPPSQNVAVPVAGYTGQFAGVQFDPAYLITFQQTHAGNTWQWSNKGLTNREACGKGGNPLMFKSPALIPAGDTVACTVQNLANTSLRVQVTLVGGSF